jgi:hypothetical protein
VEDPATLAATYTHLELSAQSAGHAVQTEPSDLSYLPDGINFLQADYVCTAAA